jgi:hypothetical protein
MGGLVSAIKDAIDDTVKLVNKAVDITIDIGKITLDTLIAPTQAIYDTIVKGESFSGSVAKQIQTLGKDLGNLYTSALDDTLGIDDGKFLGIKGGIFSKLGMLTRDFSNEHATQTIGISIIVALIIVSIIFPPAYSTAGAVTLAAFEAGVTSTFALMTVYYATLGAITLGISIVTSGIIDGAILSMYPNLLNDMYLFEQGQEALRIATLTAIMDGSIYDRLAGGWMYDSQFAGGVYYDASTCANLNISVGGEFSLTSHAINTQFGYQDSTLKDLAGSDNFSVLKLS